MKHLILPVILLLTVFTGCRKPAEPPTLTSVLISKEWKVILAKDFGVTYTSAYAGMKFTFTNDGKMKVNDGTTVYNGTWSENPNDGTFIMDVSSAQFQLDFVSQEWKVITASFTGVNLVDEEVGTTQELRFSNY
jgi:hypothetical protein